MQANAGLFSNFIKNEVYLVPFLLKIFFTEMDETALLSDIDFKPSDWYHNVLNSNFQCTCVVYLIAKNWVSFYHRNYKFPPIGRTIIVEGGR